MLPHLSCVSYLRYVHFVWDQKQVCLLDSSVILQWPLCPWSHMATNLSLILWGSKLKLQRLIHNSISALKNSPLKMPWTGQLPTCAIGAHGAIMPSQLHCSSIGPGRHQSDLRATIYFTSEQMWGRSCGCQAVSPEARVICRTWCSYPHNLQLGVTQDRDNVLTLADDSFGQPEKQS